ncbi:MAG: hypothetical protein PVF69_12580 [Gemmatimonadota bacterium]|jgi:hypothetical protein
MTDKPMTMASRGVTLRDFAIFQIKLFVDGIKDFAAIWLSTGAIILDFIAGRGKRPRLFYSVVRASERFDKWINLHSVVERMDDTGTDDGLFGASDAGDDTLIGQIEQLVRGGDTPRRVRDQRDPSARPAPDEPDPPRPPTSGGAAPE